MESVADVQDSIYGKGNGPPILPHTDDPKAVTHPRKHPSGHGETNPYTPTTVHAEKKSSDDELAFPASELPEGFPRELSFRALAAYSLIRTLSIQLRLSPFTPNVFLRALNLPYPNRLLGQIHVAILRLLLGSLRMGYHWGKGFSQVVAKKRKLDGLRWPLRAGDNLEFLDTFSWPIFYDDYCHLTADILHTAMTDTTDYVDVRHLDTSSIKSDRLEGEDLDCSVGPTSFDSPSVIYLNILEEENDEDEYMAEDDFVQADSDEDFDASDRPMKKRKSSFFTAATKCCTYSASESLVHDTSLQDQAQMATMQQDETTAHETYLHNEYSNVSSNGTKIGLKTCSAYLSGKVLSSSFPPTLLETKKEETVHDLEVRLERSLDRMNEEGGFGGSSCIPMHPGSPVPFSIEGDTSVSSTDVRQPDRRRVYQILPVCSESRNEVSSHQQEEKIENDGVAFRHSSECDSEIAYVLAKKTYSADQFKYDHAHNELATIMASTAADCSFFQPTLSEEGNSARCKSNKDDASSKFTVNEICTSPQSVGYIHSKAAIRVQTSKQHTNVEHTACKNEPRELGIGTTDDDSSRDIEHALKPNEEKESRETGTSCLSRGKSELSGSSTESHKFSDVGDPWAHFQPLLRMRSGKSYFSLPLEDKVTILEFLIDELLSVDVIAAEMARRHLSNSTLRFTCEQNLSVAQSQAADNEDVCAVCRKEGELLCCDGCIFSYHKKCLGISENEEISDVRWHCPECTLVDPASFGSFQHVRKECVEWFTKEDLKMEPQLFEGLTEPFCQSLSNSNFLCPPVLECVSSRTENPSEFLIVHGFIFGRALRGANADVNVLNLARVRHMFLGLPPKILSSWPFAQVPYDPSHLYKDYILASGAPYFSGLPELYDPSVYLSKYRLAPYPPPIRKDVEPSAFDFEHQCHPASYLEVSRRLDSRMSNDMSVIKLLRNRLFDHFKMIREYLLSLEITLGRACLLDEFWGTHRSATGGTTIWARNVKMAKSAQRLSNLAVKLVDATHPRAFLETWFDHAVKVKGFDAKNGTAVSKEMSDAIPICPDSNPTLESLNRHWERCPPSAIFCLLAKEGKSLSNWVGEYRPDLVAKAIHRSKRKKGVENSSPHLAVKNMNVGPKRLSVNGHTPGTFARREHLREKRESADSPGSSSCMHNFEKSGKELVVDLPDKELFMKPLRKRRRFDRGLPDKAQLENFDPKSVTSAKAILEARKRAKVTKFVEQQNPIFIKEMPWPVAGRKLFDPVGSLSPSIVRSLARSAGGLRAPFVTYIPSYEVGQMSHYHVWRKRTRLCASFEELSYSLRMLQTFVDTGTIRKCVVMGQRYTSGKANTTSRVVASHRDIEDGIEFYLVKEDKSQQKGRWFSSFKVDLPVLVNERMSRRTILIQQCEERQSVAKTAKAKADSIKCQFSAAAVKGKKEAVFRKTAKAGHNKSKAVVNRKVDATLRKKHAPVARAPTTQDSGIDPPDRLSLSRRAPYQCAEKAGTGPFSFNIACLSKKTIASEASLLLLLHRNHVKLLIQKHLPNTQLLERELQRLRFCHANKLKSIVISTGTQVSDDQILDQFKQVEREVAQCESYPETTLPTRAEYKQIASTVATKKNARLQHATSSLQGSNNPCIPREEFDRTVNTSSNDNRLVTNNVNQVPSGLASDYQRRFEWPGQPFLNTFQPQPCQIPEQRSTSKYEMVGSPSKRIIASTSEQNRFGYHAAPMQNMDHTLTNMQYNVMPQFEKGSRNSQTTQQLNNSRSSVSHYSSPSQHSFRNPVQSPTHASFNESRVEYHPLQKQHVQQSFPSHNCHFASFQQQQGQQFELPAKFNWMSYSTQPTQVSVHQSGTPPLHQSMTHSQYGYLQANQNQPITHKEMMQQSPAVSSNAYLLQNQQMTCAAGVAQGPEHDAAALSHPGYLDPTPIEQMNKQMASFFCWPNS